MNDETTLALPKDVWNDAEFCARLVFMAAAWRNSAYISNDAMQAVAEERIRPHVKDILYALELMLEQRPA